MIQPPADVSPEITLELAETPQAVAAAESLIREYADWLAVDLCFQGYEEEIANLARVYGPPSGRLFLAKVKGETAGCIALRPLIEAGEGEIKRLYVRPAFRGFGLGKILVDHTIEAAREIGFRRLRLDTMPQRMPAAQAMYRQLGCVETPPYYHNPVADVVFLMLDLNRET